MQWRGVDNPAGLKPPVLHFLEQLLFGLIRVAVFQALQSAAPIGVQRSDPLLMQPVPPCGER
jgi:hypothetical protein